MLTLLTPYAANMSPAACLLRPLFYCRFVALFSPPHAISPLFYYDAITISRDSAAPAPYMMLAAAMPELIVFAVFRHLMLRYAIFFIADYATRH